MDVSGVCSVFDSGPAHSYPALGSGRVTGQWGSNVSARCVLCSPLPSFYAVFSFPPLSVQLHSLTLYWLNCVS